MNEVLNLIDSFGKYLTMLKKSEKTIDLYIYEIKRIVEKYDIESIEDLKVFEDKDWLLNTFMKNLIDNNSSMTVNRIKNTMSTFCKFLVLEDIIEYNKLHEISDVKVINQKIETYTDEEIESILNYINEKIDNRKFKRNIDLKVWKMQRICIKIMLKQGLRINEVCSIRLEDVNIENGIIQVRGKGGNGEITRRTVLNKEIKTLLKDYIDYRRGIDVKEGNEFLFISPLTKKNIVPNAIRKFLKKTLEELKIEGKGCHSLRHKCATELIHKGVEVEKVAKFLGHSNSATTEKYYIKQNIEDLEELANM